MLRNLLFQAHWLLGITAGLVLAIMGVTGATLSFEDEIIHVLNPGVVTVTPAGEALTPPVLFAIASSVKPETRVTSMRLFSDPERAAQVVFAPPGGAKGKGDTHYINPYNGELLGISRGDKTLHFLEDVHRRLAAGDTGRAVTGACAITLLVMVLSGLYLRWPQVRARRWRTWLTFNPRLIGRAFLRDLHMTIGTWALLVYVVSVLTGLFFAYDWYKHGVYRLVGEIPPAQRARGERPERQTTGSQAPDVARAWYSFQDEAPAYGSVSFRLPEREGQSLQFLYLAESPPHDRAFSKIEIELDGKVKKHERYADKSNGAKLIAAMFPLHSGSWFGLPGRIVTMIAALCMPVFMVTGLMMYLARRRIAASTEPVTTVAIARN